MSGYTQDSIAPDEAWRTFDTWKSMRCELGVIFYGASGNSLYTMGRIESASNGKLQLRSDTTRASFNLARASFVYGPVQTWPRWPSPPIVEVIAVQARLETATGWRWRKGYGQSLCPPACCRNSPSLLRSFDC